MADFALRGQPIQFVFLGNTWSNRADDALCHRRHTFHKVQLRVEGLDGAQQARDFGILLQRQLVMQGVVLLRAQSTADLETTAALKI